MAVLKYGSISCQEQWIRHNSPPQGKGLYKVCCLDRNRAIMVGRRSTVLRPTDGGTQWVKQDSVCHLDVTLYSVCLTNENNGFAVGGDGTVLKTTDGGTRGALKK